MWKACHNDEDIYLIFLNVGIDNLDGKALTKERSENVLYFHKHLYNEKPNKEILFIFCLVEFGCELLIPHYLLPPIRRANKDKKIVIIGWQGRDYLYKHLCDEFWELDEKHMWLRDMVRALHHNSKTIKKLELLLKKEGSVLPSFKFGNALLEATCLKCDTKFGSKNSKQVCPHCFSSDIKQSFFAQKEKAKDKYEPLPEISQDALDYANSVSKPNMVAIFARNRISYGRNLSTCFYKDLIENLKNKNYNCVWFGEKQSILPCPDSSILDFSAQPEAKNLEFTIALLKKCQFSIQMWTASTRLSIEANIPYLIIESPDQLFGNGQEGIRLELLNVRNTPSKVLLCNYNKVINNIEQFHSCILQNIDDLENKNYGVSIGMVDDEDYVQNLIKKAGSL